MRILKKGTTSLVALSLLGILLTSIVWLGATAPDEHIRSSEHYGSEVVEFQDANFTCFIVEGWGDGLRMHLKDDSDEILGNFGALSDDLAKSGRELIFAMNGGMYMTNQEPLGLYIEDGKTYRSLNKVSDAYGNFYLKPNGVFAFNKDRAGIIKTEDWKPEDFAFATQSGPMLVIDGEIHPAFNKGSKNTHIRNGVGIVGDKIVFAISNERVTFHHFARLFRDHFKCNNALYLDGAISRMYIKKDSENVPYGDAFGVMISYSE